MSHTTDNMKELAEKIARIITEQGKDFGVDECIVDDFGRFGNFSLLCYLDFHNKGQGGTTQTIRQNSICVRLLI